MSVTTPVPDPATTELRRTPLATFQSPYGAGYMVSFSREGVFLNAGGEETGRTVPTSHERRYDDVKDQEVTLSDDDTVLTMADLWEGFSKAFDQWEAEDMA